MQVESIFNQELDTYSLQQIYSASRWSRFIGITFFVFAALMLVGAVIISANAQEIVNELDNLSDSVPQLSIYANLSPVLISAAGYVLALLIGFMGYFFFAVGKHGILFYGSHDERAFVKTFQRAKMLFMVTVGFGILGILFTLIMAFYAA